MGGEDVVFARELNALRRSPDISGLLTYSPSNDDIAPLRGLREIFTGEPHLSRIGRIIESERVDVVHVHNTMPRITPRVFAVAKHAGAATVATVHNYRSHCLNGQLYRPGYGVCHSCPRHGSFLPGVAYRCYNGSLAESSLRAVAGAVYRRRHFLDSVDRFIALTNAERAILESLGFPGERIVLKPNHVPASLFDGSVPDASLRRGVIFVGRLEEAKSALELVRLWRKVPSSIPLTVVGVGPDREAIERIRPPHVSVLGRREPGETLDLIGRSRYLIQPSRWYETFGLTMVEAMALGVPVIGLRLATREELIEDGENGFLADRWTDLLATVVRAYDSPAYSEISAHARESARDFDERVVTPRLVSVYEDVLARVRS